MRAFETAAVGAFSLARGGDIHFLLSQSLPHRTTCVFLRSWIEGEIDILSWSLRRTCIALPTASAALVPVVRLVSSVLVASRGNKKYLQSSSTARLSSGVSCEQDESAEILRDQRVIAQGYLYYISIRCKTCGKYTRREIALTVGYTTAPASDSRARS